MSRTLDHYWCPVCGQDFQFVGSLDEHEEFLQYSSCQKCDFPLIEFGCGGWSKDGCECIKNFTKNLATEHINLLIGELNAKRKYLDKRIDFYKSKIDNIDVMLNKNSNEN